MPNPFVRNGALNTSQRAATDREPVDPVPEEYEGENIPYRGVQHHGVAPTVESRMPPAYSESSPIEYETPPDEQEAVPVRVVNESSRFQRMARANTVTVGAATALEIVGRDESRTNLRVENVDDADFVTIGFRPNLVAWIDSFRLMAGKSVETKSQEAVWVLGGAADVVVTWIADYELPVND